MATTTRRPRFARVDDHTADLLTLLADTEWDTFLAALRATAADRGGLIYPNALRPLVRGHVKPNRVGAFTRRAVLEGLIEYTGDWQVSDDVTSRNRGRPMRVARWIGTTP